MFQSLQERCMSSKCAHITMHELVYWRCIIERKEQLSLDLIQNMFNRFDLLIQSYKIYNDKTDVVILSRFSLVHSRFFGTVAIPRSNFNVKGDLSARLETTSSIFVYNLISKIN